MDFKKIEEKWQKEWEDAKIFESTPDKRPKFFVNFPYPYMNAFLHVGHLFSANRVEIMARYKRMKGFNVLYPQGWHCTGQPIEAAAKRVKEGEKTQIEILKDMGFSDEEIPKFANPKHWTKIFPKENTKDFKSLGLSIDWRRSFITTNLNPHYDAFVKWQFQKLKAKGYVIKGKHPIVWCTKDNGPVPDHDRKEGEGETPQEFTLLKFKYGKEFLIAATLRPETVFGQTNVWVNPKTNYIKANVNGEIWILSKDAAEKIKYQDREIKEIGSVKGEELIGSFVSAPMIKKEIPVLPAEFCDPAIGTGIVTSVPSDAPHDYVRLKELQNDEKLCKKYGLDYEMVKSLKLIPIITTKEFGDVAAKKVCDDLEIKSLADSDKLDKAKDLVYKKGFYTGTMLEAAGDYGGKPVEEAKDLIKDKMIENRDAEKFYDLTGPVLCRCLTPSTVKIVSNQWFLDYYDPKWKKETHKALDNLKVYPSETGAGLNYTIDWLRQWACARKTGLGTKLPWDENWVIESLSDSTIYMAYYTISHKISDIDASKLTEKFFDYVFLGKGKTPIKEAKELRKEFLYWYPFDFRNSGKDLIQNHLTMCLFHHTAIFPEEHWPKGISANGWVKVNGEKMSKSSGNFYMIRDAVKEFGADATRCTEAIAGEGLDDANFEVEFAKSMNQKFSSIYDIFESQYGKGIKERKRIDDWASSRLDDFIKEVSEKMEEANHRNALKIILFDISNMIKWYMRRTTPNNDVMNRILETQLKMLAPFAPHLAEEIWHKIGNKDFISISSWPEIKSPEENKELNEEEQSIQKILDDVNHIKKLSGIDKPTLIKLIIIPKDTYIKETKEFFENELGCKVLIEEVNKSKEEKAKKAKPGRPAIVIK